MKKKTWDVTVKDNPNKVVMGENDEFYTSDTEAYLIFNLQDKFFRPQSAMITLENRSDGSLKSEEVEVVDGVVEWEMPELYIEHFGNWQVQLVYEQMKGAILEKYTSGVMAFTVNSHIKDKKKPSLVEIENWEKFIRDGTELIETWEDMEDLRQANEAQRQANYQELLDTGVLQTNINTKLEALEEEYAPKLTEVTSQLAQTIEHIEIEPESLRESALETDGTLLQKAIDLVNEDARKTKSIKLGRMYEIEKTIHVGKTISYRNQPWLIIRGSNGGLKLAHDGYMFDGDNNGGGLLFDKVKFEGTEDYKHPLMNGTHLIQVNFTQCQFYSTRTIIDSTNYLQSIRFTQCNFKQMKDYQIKSVFVADMHLLNNVVEWGQGGLLLLTQDRTNQYSGHNLVVKDNVIEGISAQIPISTTHLSGAVFDSNYFEGNELTDMDLSGGALPHRGLTITNNNFGGHAQYKEKTAGIKVGELHPTQGYNFSGNTCESVLFDFSESGSPTSIDLTGGQFRNNGRINYIGVAGSGPENSNTTIGSNVSSTSFWRGHYDKDAPSQTLNITIPRTGTYLMTTRALYGGDPDKSIHETVLLISEGRGRAPLRKTVSLSKQYHGLDESTNDLNYVFTDSLNVDVIYTHPPAPVTRLDVTIVPITNHLPI